MNTKAEQARAIARMFEIGCDASAYSAMEYMLKSREWPEWLTQVAAQIDGSKDVPLNTERV